MAAIVEKSKLTESEKAQLKGAKAAASILTAKTGSVTDIRRMGEYLLSVADVLQQTGDGEGKRFPGAVSHETADNAAAFVNTVTRGMIPKAS